MGAEIRTVQIALHIMLPPRGVGPGKGRMLRKSGIIDQDINCPELPGERCKPLLDGSRIGNIHPNRYRFDPLAHELFGHAINRLALVDQPDGGALRAEIAA